MALSLLKQCRLLCSKKLIKSEFTNRSLYLAPPFLVQDYEPVALVTHRQGDNLILLQFLTQLLAKIIFKLALNM